MHGTCPVNMLRLNGADKYGEASWRSLDSHCKAAGTHLLLSLRLCSLLGKGLSPLPVGGPHARAGGARQPVQSAAEARHAAQAGHAKGTWLLQQLL